MIFPFPNVVMAEAAQMRRNTKKRRPNHISGQARYSPQIRYG